MTAQLLLIAALALLGYFFVPYAETISGALSTAIYPFTVCYLVLFSLLQLSYKSYRIPEALQQLLGQWLRGGIVAMAATLAASSIVLELALNDLVQAKVRILVGLTIIGLAYAYVTAYISHFAAALQSDQVSTKSRTYSALMVVITIFLLNLIVPLA
ncbi:hypothetical protein [Marinobacterium jannaschii]|uniref:hypothetical protein n=1 Tax=Marinobacterium jannaschii TaxID=64970 RepID=UPI000487301C|nr:hypothetical protein [Marinobacterium jannaschii]